MVRKQDRRTKIVSFIIFKNYSFRNTKQLVGPLLLIFDGHYAHLSLRAVRLAIDHGIHLLALPSHSTHIL